MRKLRVLYHHRIASNDGQAVHIQEIVHAMREAGHEVLLVGPKWIESKSFGSDAGIVDRLKKRLPRALYEVLEYGYNVIAAARLWRACRRWKPDFIYERYNLYFVAGAWVRRFLALPLVLEVNAPLFQERAKYDGIGLRWLARRTERVAWRGADAVLPVTRVLGRMVEGEGVPASRITVIPNGIDWAKFASAPETAAAKSRLGLGDRLVLGFTGFMRDWHGLSGLVDIVARSPERFLLLVGDGPAAQSVRAHAAELGVSDRVRITGIVERHQVAEFVAAFDIALQPDVVEYASPLKLFEYLALGRPVIAPDRANIREVLEDGRNAILFPAGDFAAMAASIERLCGDEALRRRLGSAARETIDLRGLTWAGNARTICALAERLTRA